MKVGWDEGIGWDEGMGWDEGIGWDEGVGTMGVPCSGPRGTLGLMVTGREIRVPLFESTMMEGWLGAGMSLGKRGGFCCPAGLGLSFSFGWYTGGGAS